MTAPDLETELDRKTKEVVDDVEEYQLTGDRSLEAVIHHNEAKLHSMPQQVEPIPWSTASCQVETMVTKQSDSHLRASTRL